MQHHGVRGALVVEHPQHVGVRVPVVDDQGLAVPLGDRDVRPEARLLRGAALRRRCGTCPGRSRRCRAPAAGRRAPRSRAAPRPGRTAGGASFGCRATAASTASCRVGQRRRPSATTPRPRRPAPAGPRRPSRPRRSAPRPGSPVGPAGYAGLLDGEVEVGVAVEDRHGERLGRGRELAGPAGALASLAGRARVMLHDM